MPIGWYIIPYKRKDELGQVQRYCAINDYTPQIHASGGRWTETEILGNRAIVKVRATQTILNALDGAYKRLPKDQINASLSDISSGVKTILKNELVDMGYPLAEIKSRFGNDLGQYTLRDVLQFMARRRLKPRYDKQADTIILDGPEQGCRSIESVDGEVV